MIMFKNKNKQFALWGKRFVMGMEASGAVESAAAAAEKDDNEVPDMSTLQGRAVSALGKDPMPKETDQEKWDEPKNKYETAKAKIMEGSGPKRLQQAITKIGKKVEIMEAFKNVDLSDFLHAYTELSLLVVEQNELGLAVPGLDEAGLKVLDEAEAYYEGKVSVAEAEVKVPAENDSEGSRKLMAEMSELQQLLVEDFTGLPDGADKTELTTKCNKAISDRLAVLSALGSPPLTADEVASVDMFGKSKVNYEAGQKSSNPGREAGANEHMNMILSRESARRVWLSLPLKGDVGGSWRGAGMTEEVKWENSEDAAAMTAYNEAVGLFNQASSQVGWDGKYESPKDMFKQAEVKFREVLALYKARATKEATDVTESKAQAQTAHDEMWNYWKNSVPEVARDYARSLGLNEEKMGDDIFKGEGETTKEGYEEVAKHYKEAEKKYRKAVADVEALNGSASSAMEGALAQIKGEDNDDFFFFFFFFFYCTLNRSSYITTDDLKKIWETNVLQGSVEVDGDQYNAVASFSGGKVNVAIEEADKGIIEAKVRSEELNEKKLKSEVTDRITAAMKSVDYGNSGDAEKAVEDYVYDTVRRLSPAEFDLVKGQTHTVLIGEDTYKVTFDPDDREVDLEEVDD